MNDLDPELLQRYEDAAWLAMDARRRAKRREQWRDSKRRAYARQKAEGLVGHLHALSCHTREHKGNRYCRPIPVYGTVGA